MVSVNVNNSKRESSAAYLFNPKLTYNNIVDTVVDIIPRVHFIVPEKGTKTTSFFGCKKVACNTIKVSHTHLVFTLFKKLNFCRMLKLL